MRTRMLLVIFIVLILSLTAVLLIKKEKPLFIVTSPKINSFAKSDDFEYFNISILSNDIESFYFNTDYLNSASIVNVDKTRIVPIQVINIENQNEVYMFKNDILDVINIEIKVSVSANYLLEEIDEAYLILKYENNKEIELNIGEFNYLIQNLENNDIGLSNLFATHGEINGIDTTTGIYLELSNNSEHNIYIKEIRTIGSMISFDNFYLRKMEEEVEYDESVSNILNLDDFNHFRTKNIFQQNILLTEDNSIKIFAPILYHGEIVQAYRFPIMVIYEINGVEYNYTIDDFPYINTSSFKEELESEFITYEIGN